MSKEGDDAPVISQDSSEDDIRAAFYQIQALYVKQKSTLDENQVTSFFGSVILVSDWGVFFQAEIDSLKESNNELRATLDTYSQNSALTVTQQGLQACYHNVVALGAV